MSEKRDCLVLWQGRVEYSRAVHTQMQICEMKKRGFEKDVLLLLEHPPTITMGRRGRADHLLVKEEILRSRGIDFQNSDRGGDITFHGPGQLVGYPILTLEGRERDVHGYMWTLEESLIRLLSRYGIRATRNAGFTGVWTQMGKIAAMGVHISRWITRHGFALNVNTDLSYYDLIVPCGIVGKTITSMRKHLLREIDLGESAIRYVDEFGSVFNRNMIRTEEQSLMKTIWKHYEETGQTGPAPSSNNPG